VLANSKDKTYGFVKRISYSSKSAVIFPMAGIFEKNTLVNVYDDNGIKIGIGTVKSIYSDEIYILLDGNLLENIRKGFIVSTQDTAGNVFLLSKDKIEQGLKKLTEQELEIENDYKANKKKLAGGFRLKAVNAPHIEYTSYLASIKRRIEVALIDNLPTIAVTGTEGGELNVEFVVNNDGDLGTVMIVRRSGNDILDFVSTRAIFYAAPYDPIPKNFKIDLLQIHAHFVFQSNNR